MPRAGRPADRHDPAARPGVAASSPPPGEAAARERMHAFLRDGLDALRRAPRPPRRRHVRALALPALRLPQRARAGGARERSHAFTRQLALARLLRPGAAATTRGNAHHAFQRAMDGSSGRAARTSSPPGGRAAPAIPWSTPGCASSRRTGWMHNRARLITACFLVKDLHVDWRARRGALHAPAGLRRRRPEQRQLAVDLLGRRRPRAGAAAASTTRCCSSAATTRTARTCAAGCPSCARAAASGWPTPHEMTRGRAGGRPAA